MVKMFDSPLVLALVGYSWLGLTGLAGCLVGASMYDLREAKVRQDIRQHPYTKLNRHRPLISIVIYINNRQSLSNCLQSIAQSSYRNYDITLVDDMQEDSNEIHEVINSFKAQYPKSTVHILHRRKKTSQAQAVAAATKKWARGELIMNLDADSLLDRQALRNATRYFINDKVTVLLPNVQIKFYPSIVGVFQQLEQLLRLSTKKFMSIAKLNYASRVSSIIYRRPTILTKQQRAYTANKYGSDVLIFAAPATSWSRLLRTIYRRKQDALYSFHTSRSKSRINKSSMKPKPNRLRAAEHFVFVTLFQLMIVLTPLIISYLLYLAIYFKQSALYGLSWVIFSVVLFGAIWSKGYLSILKRLGLTLLVPIMYVLFYVMSIFQVIVLVISIFTRSKALRIELLFPPSS